MTDNVVLLVKNTHRTYYMMSKMSSIAWSYNVRERSNREVFIVGDEQFWFMTPSDIYRSIRGMRVDLLIKIDDVETLLNDDQRATLYPVSDDTRLMTEGFFMNQFREYLRTEREEFKGLRPSPLPVINLVPEELFTI
jgi:hypothetical protein